MMYYVSTRNNTIRKTLSEAISLGLATDGGLFIPESFPKIDLTNFSTKMSFPDFSYKLLHEFFAGDSLDEKLLTICKNAFSFPLLLKKISAHTLILELFHGPTSSFKDIGARFLAECLNAMSYQHKTTIMVATSGDTGSAVASAFYLKPNINVVILYPKGRISARQQHQITCWDTNILALAVDGSFDQCQKMVKDAFKDPWWQTHLHLCSANSINIGRLLPQMIYYAYTSILFYQDHNVAPGFIIPTGNLGNATAAYWAKIMGFPIREIVLATNENKVIPDYLQTGIYTPRPSLITLANAMDVGDPSNFERLCYLFHDYESFKKNVHAISVSDENIKKTIQMVFKNEKIIICPHTATAFYVRQQLNELPWIVVATADPSKFDTTVEGIIHTKVPVAAPLQSLLERPSHVVSVGNKLTDLQDMLKTIR